MSHIMLWLWVKLYDKTALKQVVSKNQRSRTTLPTCHFHMVSAGQLAVVRGMHEIRGSPSFNWGLASLVTS